MLSSRDSRGQFATLKPSAINAVIDSPEQVVHFAGADLCFCIIERDGAAKTALWKLQPGPRLFDVAKNIRGMLEQSRKAHDLIGLIGRQSSGRFAPLQGGS